MNWNESSFGQFLDRTLVTPLVSFLKQGLSPEKLALCVALGLLLGTFPVLGSTTLLCAAVAIIFKLNMPAIQLINYFVYPLQLLLFIPLIRGGELLFNQPSVELDLVQIFTLLRTDLMGTINSLWLTNLRAIVAWVLTAPFIAVIVYFILVPIFRRLASQKLV